MGGKGRQLDARVRQGSMTRFGDVPAPGPPRTKMTVTSFGSNAGDEVALVVAGGGSSEVGAEGTAGMSEAGRAGSGESRVGGRESKEVCRAGRGGGRRTKREEQGERERGRRRGRTDSWCGSTSTVPS